MVVEANEAAVYCTFRHGASAPVRQETTRRTGEQGAIETLESVGMLPGLKDVAYVAGARVGPPVAHARDELGVGAADRVVLAVRASEAQRAVGRTLRAQQEQ